MQHLTCDMDYMHVFVLSNYLRNSETGNGETGDDIGPEELEIVFRCPLENGEEELDSEEQFPGPLLVLESIKRVIREKDFRQLVFEFLCGCFLGWQTHTVYHLKWWLVVAGC